MSQLFECVPDYSEGKDRSKVDAIVAELTAVDGVKLLDVQLDGDHNRSVVTIVGEGDALVEAAFRSAVKAIELIDLNHHKGEHPRMGAMDVCPFTPLKNASMKDAVALANKLGKRLGEELEVPVFLYGDAATRNDRRALPNVRRGEFEGLRDEIGKNPDKVPDYGPNKIHATAGAFAVGAREFLIAFNVNLDSTDLEAAKEIAKNIRGTSGGFKFVRSMGFPLAERDNIAQVSMNLVNYKVSGMLAVYNAIREQAEAKGIKVLDGELVGLVPNDALVDVAVKHLQIADFSSSQIIENKLTEAGVEGAFTAQPDIYECYQPFFEVLSSKAPTPGGGTVSAVVGALAGALGSMVAFLTSGKPQFKDIKDQCLECKENLGRLCDELKDLARKDAEAFDEVAKCLAMPRATDEEKEKRLKVMEDATYGAIKIPIEVMEKCLEVLEVINVVAEIGTPAAASDVGVGTLLGLAGLRGAKLNVDINLLGITNQDYVTETSTHAEHLLAKAQELEKSALAKVAEKMK
ncbi:glutamate formimidoyltransferase [Planctomycetota bacterium]